MKIKKVFIVEIIFAVVAFLMFIGVIIALDNDGNIAQDIELCKFRQNPTSDINILVYMPDSSQITNYRSQVSFERQYISLEDSLGQIKYILDFPEDAKLIANDTDWCVMEFSNGRIASFLLDRGVYSKQNLAQIARGVQKMLNRYKSEDEIKGLPLEEINQYCRSLYRVFAPVETICSIE